MALLIRIEDCRTQRVWWEIRETEEEADALTESINSIHNADEWTHLICWAELNDDGPDWLPHLRPYVRATERHSEGDG